MRAGIGSVSISLAVMAALGGCKTQHPSVTAMPASFTNMHEPPGIPFYLPKPLLVVSKNFHHIEHPQVGAGSAVPIPETFDQQDQYGMISPDVQSSPPPAAPPAGDDSEEKHIVHFEEDRLTPGVFDAPIDGLAPTTFFTYELIFVPDLTQKYVLNIEGGAGEMRGAMDLVNGWMFTGLGPYYLKDSSTAQNILAQGSAARLVLGGAADVVNSLAQFQPAAAGSRGITPNELRDLARTMSRAAQQETFDFSEPGGIVERYAEIFVYEPYVDDCGMMAWRPVIGEMDPETGTMRGLQFDREYLGTASLIPAGPPLDALERSLEILSDQEGPEDAASRAALPRDDLTGVADVEPLPSVPSLTEEVIRSTLNPTVVKDHPNLHDVFEYLFHGHGSVENRAVTLPVR